MKLSKYINYLNSQFDIIAYRETKDIANNTYFVAIVETSIFNGAVLYYLYNIHNIYGNEFCRDLRGFSSYKTIDLAIEAIERICGGNITTIIK